MGTPVYWGWFLLNKTVAQRIFWVKSKDGSCTPSII